MPQSHRQFLPGIRYGFAATAAQVETKDFTIDPFIHVGCEHLVPCPICGDRFPHLDSIVIACAGRCVDSLSDQPRAAVGVYSGNDANHNISLPVTAADRMTYNLAEIMAVKMALCEVAWMQVLGKFRALRQVVIKTTSDYVVRAMTTLINDWVETPDGYVTLRGPVPYGATFKEVERSVRQLNRMRIEVLFWCVPRTSNYMANIRANAVFKPPRAPGSSRWTVTTPTQFSS